MNTTRRWTVVIVAVVIGVALFAGGNALAQTNGSAPFGSGYNMTLAPALRSDASAGVNGYAPNQTGAAQMPYGNMMGYGQTYSGTVPYGMMNGNMPGIMGNGMMNGGMLGYGQTYSGTVPDGMLNGDMMEGFGSNNPTGAKPLSIDQAKAAVEKYIADLNNSDLSLKEIMIFDNNAYARITEKSTGIGAFEVLVDPATLTVYPEYGPNMMWNLKYGMMSNAGGMMGNRQSAPQANGQMPISADEAVQTAQRYLDTSLPGTHTSTSPDQFYGYYTIEILRNDKPSGMLSVNGYTAQVFLHTWHGIFIELSED